jgi:hypothetical protein
VVDLPGRWRIRGPAQQSQGETWGITGVQRQSECRAGRREGDVANQELSAVCKGAAHLSEASVSFVHAAAAAAAANAATAAGRPLLGGVQSEGRLRRPRSRTSRPASGAAPWRQPATGTAPGTPGRQTRGPGRRGDPVTRRAAPLLHATGTYYMIGRRRRRRRERRDRGRAASHSRGSGPQSPHRIRQSRCPPRGCQAPAGLPPPRRSAASSRPPAALTADAAPRSGAPGIPEAVPQRRGSRNNGTHPSRGCRAGI